MATSPDVPEPDDNLHTPDPKRDKTIDMGGTICTLRGFWNLGCLVSVFVSCILQKKRMEMSGIELTGTFSCSLSLFASCLGFCTFP